MSFSRSRVAYRQVERFISRPAPPTHVHLFRAVCTWSPALVGGAGDNSERRQVGPHATPHSHNRLILLLSQIPHSRAVSNMEPAQNAVESEDASMNSPPGH